ncbi:hypothetical protein Patl1_07812 [Pistacia atlantica]|uniref:Uncharacterized protein n=1 Tax=Pistacia atlantica TaxID=434234 RepID=A0ACC1AEK2_9ROSI|nr:hypothetical protein Patl1_07812 [Pistacia atlantica]
MNSSTSHSARAQIVAKSCDNIFPMKKNPPSSRRTPSFSSSSSSSSFESSSYFPDDSPLSPATPLRFSGVPFSWEHLPGIPKKIDNNKKESFLKQLPLPPPLTPQKLHFDPDIGVKKKFNSNGDHSFRKDPFVAALVECSKDDDDDDLTSSKLFWNGGKVTRSISDRLWICKSLHFL